MLRERFPERPTRPSLLTTPMRRRDTMVTDT